MDFSKIGELVQSIVVEVSDAIWTYVLIGVLILCGIWFTLRTRFVQIRMFPQMIRLLGESAVSQNGHKHISSFQAFAVSVATRVGTGNLAGVAIAITVGGPGAVFWMWIIAIIGSATSFVESTLAQLFKRREKDSFIGGPAYYIQSGLGMRWLSITCSVLLIITFGLVYNSIQSNTISASLEHSFGWNPLYSGIVLAAISLFVVFGGIQRVAKVSSVLVPIMALGYLLVALVVVLMNISELPHILKLIFTSAFGLDSAAGGMLGAALQNGIKRGLFSNEAGEGSAPNAAATATVSHPVRQGLIQALGVFTDTLLVCSCTAFIILLSNAYSSGESNGIELTQIALENEIGPAGSYIVSIALLFFAFSSIIGNYYYGEANIRFLTPSGNVLTIYRLFSGGVVIILGAVSSLDLVWSMGDLFMAMLTASNLIAISLLGKYVFRLLEDYRKKKAQGIRDPQFSRMEMPDIADKIECWD